VRELELLQSYLTRLRQERLQQGHAAALGAGSPDALIQIVARAHEAELVSRILAAVKDLDKDPGVFIKNHLSTL
jgi:hypothetical protein